MTTNSGVKAAGSQAAHGVKQYSEHRVHHCSLKPGNNQRQFIASSLVLRQKTNRIYAFWRRVVLWCLVECGIR
jgi:hypothetical protein